MRGASKKWTEARLAEVAGVLRRCGGNKSRAAQELGISRSGVHELVNRFRLDCDPIQPLPRVRYGVQILSPLGGFTVGMFPMESVDLRRLELNVRAGIWRVAMIQEPVPVEREDIQEPVLAFARSA